MPALIGCVVVKLLFWHGIFAGTVFRLHIVPSEFHRPVCARRRWCIWIQHLVILAPRRRPPVDADVQGEGKER